MSGCITPMNVITDQVFGRVNNVNPSVQLPFTHEIKKKNKSLKKMVDISRL